MEYSNDHFDIQDDEHDSADFTSEELSRYFLSKHIETIMNEQYYQEQEDQEEDQKEEEGRTQEMMDIDPSNDQNTIVQVNLYTPVA